MFRITELLTRVYSAPNDVGLGGGGRRAGGSFGAPHQERHRFATMLPSDLKGGLRVHCKDPDDDDDDDGEGGGTATKTKEIGEKVEKLRTNLLERIGEMAKDAGGSAGENRAEVERREKEMGGYVDEIAELIKAQESDEVRELTKRIRAIEREPVGDRKGGQTHSVKGTDGRMVDRKRFDGDNLFAAKREMAKGNVKLAEKVSEYEAQWDTPERLKVWASGDLEDVDLVVPDIQAALPYLAAAAKVPQLCRELRTTSPSVEFPVYTSGLTVDVVPETEPKPESEPDFELLEARVYTIAGLTQVPNQTLEDYPVARGWISTELGRATGVREEQLVLAGTGVGQPTGILNNSLITGRATAGQTGKDYIEAIFRAMQDVRADGFTEPTNIVLNPRVWTDIVLSFEANVGYLYGPPQGSGFPEGEPAARLLGLPVTQDSYVSTTYGSQSNDAPVVVGNFQDAIVLRRSPFRVDVDTSLGFKNNTTWFRGEERMGFLVVRPKSFKVVTEISPSA